VHREPIVIVTPALADANNGNWQTARRWARWLSGAYRVRLAAHWEEGDETLMIALHARRSAASIRAWREQRGDAPLLLVLTGTDLYRDIAGDADAQRSLRLADALVVLNAHGPEQLDAEARARCHVVLQSCPARRPGAKPTRHLRALMVGHLREEKDPSTYLRAAARLAHRHDIRLDHIGAALDPSLGVQASELSARQPNYRWLGPLPHTQTRRRIQAAHVLVHASRMEGGANVVIEALRSGTPVIASRIAGNLGLLGDDWPATFEVGDDAALAATLERVRDEPAMLADLQRRAAERASLFTPEAEAAALLRVVRGLIDAQRRSHPA
jgi:putative glycosyltransferase (TIGR04348 family)